VEIEFDPAKDAVNIAKHGVSLKDAELFDFSSAVVLHDDRRDYGEARFRGFARMGGLGFCLVFAVVSETTIRAISYRRAHEKEMRRHVD
jgi:hypothetical protein